MKYDSPPPSEVVVILFPNLYMYIDRLISYVTRKKEKKEGATYVQYLSPIEAWNILYVRFNLNENRISKAQLFWRRETYLSTVPSAEKATRRTRPSDVVWLQLD